MGWHGGEVRRKSGSLVITAYVSCLNLAQEICSEVVFTYIMCMPRKECKAGCPTTIHCFCELRHMPHCPSYHNESLHKSRVLMMHVLAQKFLSQRRTITYLFAQGIGQHLT